MYIYIYVYIHMQHFLKLLRSPISFGKLRSRTILLIWQIPRMGGPRYRSTNTVTTILILVLASKQGPLTLGKPPYRPATYQRVDLLKWASFSSKAICREDSWWSHFRHSRMLLSLRLCGSYGVCLLIEMLYYTLCVLRTGYPQACAIAAILSAITTLFPQLLNMLLYYTSFIGFLIISIKRTNSSCYMCPKKT